MSESIYNLVPREYIVPEKKPFHRSNRNHAASLTGSTFGCKGTTRLPGAGAIVKQDGAMFGPNPILSRDISPLAKREEEAAARATGKFAYEDVRKLALPARSERPVMGIKTGKNFITANAVEAILQVPRVVESGELNYMKKEDFGKVPAYLTQVREEIRRENEMIDKYVKEQMGEVEKEPEQFEEMSDEERGELIASLKAKWDDVNAKYQKITHLVQLDTTGQVRRKEHLEGAMKQLEHDIEKLERAGPIKITRK